MNKKEVQKRVLQNGKPLALSKFSWDEKTNTFSSNEDNLVIDFYDKSVTVTTGYRSTITTGYDSTVTTGYDSTIKTGNCSTITTGYRSTITTGYRSTVTTDYDSTVTTGYDSTVTTGYDSTVTTGAWSTVTTGKNCAVVIFNSNLPVQMVIGNNDAIQTAPYNIKGYLKDGIYSETGKPAIICDGILSEVISQKGNVYKVINYGDTKESYLIKDGDIYSHGETLEQAKESLIYKISNRDTTPYKSWKLTDTKTKEELIKAYRVITGACESGTKYFCENTNIPDKCTVKEAIELTKGQYNQEKFKEFFKGVK